MWESIIGAGVSALGSLFGGGDDEKTETTINYKKMAREAEKAGFNPLTAIRNGGSAGFTTTTHPGLSMMDRFGQAFQTIGNAIMSFDARADERAELELRMQRAELDRIQRSGLAEGSRMSFDVPHAAGSTMSSSAASAGTGILARPAPLNGPAAPLVAPYVDEYGNRLTGPHIDAPDPESILTGPALRLQKRYLDWWEKSYGDKAPAYSQRTWQTLSDWFGTVPPAPAALEPIFRAPALSGSGRGITKWTAPAKRGN